MGKYDVRGRLELWLRHAVYVIPTQSDGAPCRIVKVRHIEGDAKSSTVGDYYIDTNGPGANTETLAETIMSALEDDANACGGLQRYTVRAYYGATTDKLEQKGGRFVLSVKAEKEDIHEDALDSEPRNSAGQQSQIMRHNEAYARAMLSGSAESSRILSSVVQMLVNQNQTLSQQSLALMQQLQDSLDRKADREVNAFRTHSQEKRKDKVFEKMALLMPYMINKLAGGSVMQVENTPESQQIAAFMKSLSKEQVEAFMTVLGPEQMTLMLGLAEKYAEKAPAQLEGKKEELCSVVKCVGRPMATSLASVVRYVESLGAF
jgi:hypothetical protein